MVAERLLYIGGGLIMWKKLLSGFVISVGILTMSTNVEAAKIDNNMIKIEENVSQNSQKMLARRGQGRRKLTTNVAGYEVIKPDRDSYSTEESVALINGKAPARSAITIRLYGTTDLTRKNYNLNKLPKDSEYIEQFSETVHSGNLGFFQKQLDLVKGINKIVIEFEDTNVNPIEIIVNVYDRAPSLDEMMSRMNK